MIFVDLFRLFNRLDYFFLNKGLFLSRRELVHSDEKFEGLDLCGENISKDQTPKVMINVIKEKQTGKEDMDAYVQKVVFELFPRIGSSVLDSGVPLTGGWSQVGDLLLHSQFLAF